MPLDDDTGMLAVGSQRQMLAVSRTQEIMSELVVTRNVTNMVGLMQELAQEHVHGDSLTEELRVLIRSILTLTHDIKTALRAEHSNDTAILDSLPTCFDDARQTLERAKEAATVRKEAATARFDTYTSCRKKVLDLYESKITSCEAYDTHIAGLAVPHVTTEQECVWGDGDDVVLKSMKELRTWAMDNTKLLEDLHKKCAKAMHDYAAADKECDEEHVEFEADICSIRQDEWNACNDNYQTSCSACSVNFDKVVNEMECRETDRKIDWSAAEKIKCYVQVLLKSPSDYNISENCVEGKTCLSDVRIEEYKKCEKLCENVDYESDDYAMIDGVNTTHRHEIEEMEKRCTREMDLHFPAKKPCAPCPDLEPYPCGSTFIDQHYAMFKKDTWIAGIDAETKECAGYEHTEVSAYSLPECLPCRGTFPQRLEDPFAAERAACEKSGGRFGDEIIVEYTRAEGAQDRDWVCIRNLLVNGENPKAEPAVSNYGNWHEGKLATDKGSWTWWCSQGYPTTTKFDKGTTEWLSSKLGEPTCIKDIEFRQDGGYSPYQGDGAYSFGKGEFQVKVISEGIIQWTSPVVMANKAPDWKDAGQSGAYKGRGFFELAFDMKQEE